MPRLTLFQDSRPLASNAGWDDAAFPEIISAAARQVSAFALDRDSGDTALLVKLEPGAYTDAVSSRTAGATGVALMEVYALRE